MRKRLLIVLSALAVTIALAAPAAAQQPNRPLTGGDKDSRLVGLGLTFMNAGDETGVGVAGNVLLNTLKVTSSGRLGVVADAGLNHFDGGTVVTLMGGARYTFTTSGKIIPYGQFLLGILHSPNNTDFDPAIGFGADIAWKDNLNFRGEVTFIFGDLDATRWFIGVSLPMKKK